MKMTVEWHEECLKNATRSEQAYLDEIARIRANWKKLSKENKFRRLQIDTARLEKKDSFDAERFMVNRKNNKG